MAEASDSVVIVPAVPTEAPESPEVLQPVERPLSRLQRACGITDEQLATADEVGGEAYGTHRAYDAESLCEGTFRVQDKSESLWIVQCDTCRCEVGVNMRTADPERLEAERLAAAELPEMFAGKDFKSDERAQEPTLKACREWIKTMKRDPVPAIALWGDPGRGKSHLLSLMVETTIRVHHGRALYRSAIGMLDNLAEGFDAGEYEKRWRRLLEVPVLALDDLGVERMTDWRKERLAELVDVRYRNGRPLLVATNIPPGGWENAFGGRTTSRLRGMCLPFRLEGPDRRAQGVQQALEA